MPRATRCWSPTRSRARCGWARPRRGIHAPEVQKLLKTKQIPFVNTYNNEGDPCIGFNNRAAAARVVDYLYNLGHREFAVITSPLEQRPHCGEPNRLSGGTRSSPDRPCARARGRGALHDRRWSTGAGLFASLVIPCHGGALRVADGPAIDALEKCRSLCIRVPEDLSVTGFDDLDLAMYMNPR